MDLKGDYSVSENGNFKVVDTIGVPHPYCITPRHLHYCDSMILDKESIRRAEKRGAKCGVKNCNLSFSEHKEALLISCKIKFGEDNKEINDFLLSNKEEAEANGYEGFAFKKDF